MLSLVTFYRSFQACKSAAKIFPLKCPNNIICAHASKQNDHTNTRKTDTTWYHTKTDITCMISSHPHDIDITWYHLTCYHVISTSNRNWWKNGKRWKISFYFAEKWRFVCRKFILNRIYYGLCQRAITIEQNGNCFDLK